MVLRQRFSQKHSSRIRAQRNSRSYTRTRPRSSTTAPPALLSLHRRHRALSRSPALAPPALSSLQRHHTTPCHRDSSLDTAKRMFTCWSLVSLAHTVSIKGRAGSGGARGGEGGSGDGLGGGGGGALGGASAGGGAGGGKGGGAPAFEAHPGDSSPSRESEKTHVSVPAPPLPTPLAAAPSARPLVAHSPLPNADCLRFAWRQRWRMQRRHGRQS